MEVEERVKQSSNSVESLLADVQTQVAEAEALADIVSPEKRKSSIGKAKLTENKTLAPASAKARRRKSLVIAEDSPEETGVAAWVLTFADLMSLLMAFFVLLYSMSEVDKSKFEQFGQSMRVALGKPVMLNADIENIEPSLAPTPEQVKEQTEKTRLDAEALKQLLQPQIEEKKVEVEQHGQVIMIRMLQKGVFKSGEATLVDDFIPVLEKISEKLNVIEGELIVSGHTDNIPVFGERFRSNWELSAARSYSVIEVLQTMGQIPQKRFILRGFGDTRPLEDNDTPHNRAQNRRVEIMIDQRVSKLDAKQENEIDDLQRTADGVLSSKGKL